MNTSESTAAIAAALAKAHLEIENPELDGVNPHFKSRFSTLAAVLNAVRKPLARNGIAMMQSVAIEEGRVAVTTSLMHSSGEWLREMMAFPIPNNATVQQAGACVTYLRRYSLISLCGIVGDPNEDDDGESDRQEREEQRKRDAQQRAVQHRASAKPAPAKPAPAPAQATGTMDKFPDEGDHIVQVKRVVQRGKAWAVHVVSEEHGTAWIKTNVEDYAKFLDEQAASGEVVSVSLNRVDANTLELLAIKSPRKTGAKPVDVPEESLPF